MDIMIWTVLLTLTIVQLARQIDGTVRRCRLPSLCRLGRLLLEHPSQAVPQLRPRAAGRGPVHDNSEQRRGGG